MQQMQRGLLLSMQGCKAAGSLVKGMKWQRVVPMSRRQLISLVQDSRRHSSSNRHSIRQSINPGKRLSSCCTP